MNVFDRFLRVESNQFRAAAIIVEDRSDAGIEDGQAITNHFRLIFIGVIQVFALALAIRAGHERIGFIVETLGAHLADSPAKESFEGQFLRHLQIKDRIDRSVNFTEHLIEKLGLFRRSGESIENNSLSGIGEPEPFFNHGFDDFVRHKFAARGVFLSQQSQGGPFLNVLAKEIARTEVDQAEAGHQHVNLSALSCPRRTDDCEIHKSKAG